MHDMLSCPVTRMLMTDRCHQSSLLLAACGATYMHYASVLLAYYMSVAALADDCWATSQFEEHTATRSAAEQNE